jgi:hypothetical protein
VCCVLFVPGHRPFPLSFNIMIHNPPAYSRKTLKKGLSMVILLRILFFRILFKWEISNAVFHDPSRTPSNSILNLRFGPIRHNSSTTLRLVPVMFVFARISHDLDKAKPVGSPCKPFHSPARHVRTSLAHLSVVVAPIFGTRATHDMFCSRCFSHSHLARKCSCPVRCRRCLVLGHYERHRFNRRAKTSMRLL